MNFHRAAGDLSEDALWTKLFNLNFAGEIIMAGSPAGSDTTYNSVGIV